MTSRWRRKASGARREPELQMNNLPARGAAREAWARRSARRQKGTYFHLRFCLCPSASYLFSLRVRHVKAKWARPMMSHDQWNNNAITLPVLRSLTKSRSRTSNSNVPSGQPPQVNRVCECGAASGVSPNDLRNSLTFRFNSIHLFV